MLVTLEWNHISIFRNNTFDTFLSLTETLKLITFLVAKNNVRLDIQYLIQFSIFLLEI